MKKKLKYYGGKGYEYSNENGNFEVKANEVKKFTRLSKAKEHYDNLNEEKAIWDTTTMPELLSCHVEK
ncbi:MAG TPA: hypothetical protein EYN89_10045 [Flavobacteriales bacterium]|nr:hypothetical protein [Flavobacteriales bacterium]